MPKTTQKLFISFLIVFTIILRLDGQILSVDPVFPTVNDTVTITYNASQGNGELVGISPVYAHTGVITNQSTAPNDWKNVQGNWGQPDSKVFMTDLGNDLHQISYHIKSFYGIGSGVTVEKLAFVFRNTNGSKVGREADGSDIFYPVYSGGVLDIAILTPGGAVFAEVNDQIPFSAAASDSSDLYLYENGTLLSQTSGKTLQYTYSPVSSGNKWLKFEADNGSSVRSDSVLVVVRGAVNTAIVPSGNDFGINYKDDSTVILSLFAPNKDFVYVVGDFNSWQPDANYLMNRTPDQSIWWLEVSGLNPGEEYAFQYWVDGSIKIGDPYADKVLDPWNDQWISAQTYPGLKPYPEGMTQEPVSVLQTAQTPYQWQTTSWNRPAQDELVVYELLIRDFVATHDYQTLIDTLSYLQQLGINAIELMPVMEFEGNSSWGYNPSFFFAPDKYYGPKDDLKAFIDTCHSRGIAVILDMVLNHAFGQCPLVRLYWDAANNKPAAESPWFNPDARHPFNVGYDFNHESQATKDFADRVLAYWVEEYHFDGYRMDLSKGFTQVNSGNDVGAWGNFDISRINLLKRMFDQLRSVDPEAYFILEHFAANSEEQELSNYGMMLWGNLVHNYNEATMGYLSESNFDWISYQKRGWNDPHVMGYMESHDEERLMFKNITYGNAKGGYNTRDLNTALARMEAAAAFFFTIPGPKMLWQFGELGYDVSIDQNGRTGEKPIKWEYFQNPSRNRLYSVYSALIHLRQEHNVFATDQFSLTLSGAFKKINLNDPQMNVTVIGNFDVDFATGDPGFQHTGWWYDYFTGDSVNITDVNASILLEAGEYHLYTDVRLNKPELSLDLAEDFVSDHGISSFPNPFYQSIRTSLSLERPESVSFRVRNMNGALIQTVVNNQTYQPGYHEISWEGTDATGQEVAAGIYLLEIRIGTKSVFRKVIKAN